MSRKQTTQPQPLRPFQPTRRQRLRKKVKSVVPYALTGVALMGAAYQKGKANGETIDLRVELYPEHDSTEPVVDLGAKDMPSKDFHLKKNKKK